MRLPFVAFVLGLSSLLPPAAHAGKAHEHGVARLDVAVEERRVVFALEMPLDNLVGFERAPRTDAERRAVDAAVAKLKDAAALFRIDAAAGCKPSAFDLQSGALGLGGAAPSKDGHDDLDGSFEFACADARKAGFVETGLFAAFPRLQRVEVQVAGPRGQAKAVLKRPEGRLPLAR